MDRFVMLTVLVAACVVFGLAATSEASLPIKAVKTLAPRVQVMAAKVCNGVSGFLWKNKGTVATGVVLTTFASNPEPFVQGATTVATATAEKVIDAVVPKVGEKKIGTSTTKSGSWMILAGLLVAIGSVIAFRNRLQWKLFVPIVVFLIVFFAICCCGVVRADTIGSIPEVASAGARLNILDILVILLLIFFGA